MRFVRDFKQTMQRAKTNPIVTQELRAAQREAEEYLEQAIAVKTELEEAKERNAQLIERLAAAKDALEAEKGAKDQLVRELDAAKTELEKALERNREPKGK